MDHAVRLDHVGDRDLGRVAAFVDDIQVAAFDLRRQRITRQGHHIVAPAVGLGLGHDVSPGQAARNHMRRQNLGQHRLVFRLEQRVNRASGQGREGFIGRREHGERARTRQGIDQTGGLDGGYQRGVISGIHRVFDDVLRREHRGTTDHRVFGKGGGGKDTKGKRRGEDVRFHDVLPEFGADHPTVAERTKA